MKPRRTGEPDLGQPDQVCRLPHPYAWWWLRSPGGESDAAKAIINANGQVITGGNWVDNNDAVRPCMWIDLNA